MDQQVLQIKMQAAQLQSEAQKVLKECVKERLIAKNDLKKGNRQTAALHAQNAVRYEQQAKQMLQNVAALNGYAVNLEQAQTSASMAKTMNQAASSIQKNEKQTNLNQLSANRTKMDGLKQNMGAAHDLLTNGEGQMDLNAGADDLLSTLEDEVTMDNIAQMPTIPLGQQQQQHVQNNPAAAKTTLPGQTMSTA